jgi:hypothetical protein
LLIFSLRAFFGPEWRRRAPVALGYSRRQGQRTVGLGVRRNRLAGFGYYSAAEPSWFVTDDDPGNRRLRKLVTERKTQRRAR